MKRLLPVFLFLVTALGFAQNKEKKISWNENSPLVWERFEGKPASSSAYHANTSSGISFGWSLKTSGDTSEFFYEVGSHFYPKRSWVKGKTSSQHLLAHEQLHFDISELFARRLRQSLSLYVVGPEIKQELNQIYEENEKRRQEMQTKYDKETNHSLLKEEQSKWEEYVWRELKSLEAFSS